MTANDIFTEIHQYCLANTNEANVKKYSKFFKEFYDAYGLISPQIHSKVKEIVKRKDINLQNVIDVAPMLFATKKYEETGFALLLFAEFAKQFTKETFKIIGSYFSYTIHNWAHADTLGMLVLPLFVKNKVISLKDFEPWLNSEFKFKRRCVPVTLIKSLKNTTDYSEFFTFLEPLMNDTEREVHQGIGWFLREAWKKQPIQTEEFLLKWKQTAPRLIIQYATEKMTSEQKLLFKREKKV